MARGKTSGDKVFMSHRGKRIWYTRTGDGEPLYMVARGDGMDEYFTDWKDAMDWIDKRKDGLNMAHILCQGSEITPETAMKWFCWHEIINVMEKDLNSLDAAIKAVERNVPDWEMRVLQKFLELTDRDFIF